MFSFNLQRARHNSHNESGEIFFNCFRFGIINLLKYFQIVESKSSEIKSDKMFCDKNTFRG